MNNKWTPDSWKEKKALHQPIYNNKDDLDLVIKKLKNLPPLVFAGEVRELKKELSQCVDGRGFLLQAGDCAESFAEFHPDNIRDTFRVILQMAIVLTYAANVPVVKLGRLAGQFAKPRSNPTEVQDGIELPSYLGDIINSINFDEKSRAANPKRMVDAYNQSASTQNLIRAFATGGYADLSYVQNWNLDFVKNSPQGSAFKKIADRISESLSFMNACGINSNSSRELAESNFFISHEALLLPYESCFARIDSTTGDWYDVSAHMVWIGDRTRQIDGAHVEFCSGISNPIGIKVGPSTDPDELLKLIEKLNPFNESGKIVLIVRMGSEKVIDLFPPILRKVKEEGKNVVWSCDPMHGNIEKSNSGYKTRNFSNILTEVKSFFEIHKNEKTYAGGIHLEMTGQNVTECLGGMQKITDKDLGSRYHTHCDPRLNASQSIELAFLLAGSLKNF
ncbi:3-deoxy-7-phosphoheptulonate synthase class II [Rickettsiales bacterium]|nr:3-deoxy-7-phosphoheptulonate synthase class II [Rickettsiales bacterium]